MSTNKKYRMTALNLLLLFMFSFVNSAQSESKKQDDLQSMLQEMNTQAYQPYAEKIINNLDKSKLVHKNQWRTIRNLAGDSYLYKNPEGVYYRIFASSLIVFIPEAQIFKANYLNSICINAIESFSNKKTNKDDKDSIELITFKLVNVASKKVDRSEFFKTSFGLSAKFYVSSFGEKGVYCSMQ